MQEGRSQGLSIGGARRKILRFEDRRFRSVQVRDRV